MEKLRFQYDHNVKLPLLSSQYDCKSFPEWLLFPSKRGKQSQKSLTQWTPNRKGPPLSEPPAGGLPFFTFSLLFALLASRALNATSFTFFNAFSYFLLLFFLFFPLPFSFSLAQQEIILCAFAVLVSSAWERMKVAITFAYTVSESFPIIGLSYAHVSIPMYITLITKANPHLSLSLSLFLFHYIYVFLSERNVDFNTEDCSAISLLTRILFIPLTRLEFIGRIVFYLSPE